MDDSGRIRMHLQSIPVSTSLRQCLRARFKTDEMLFLRGLRVRLEFVFQMLGKQPHP